MFSYFWDTSETIPSGLGFPQFGTIHLFWLMVTFVVCLVTVHIYRKLQPSGRRKLLIGIAVLLLIDELFKWIMLFIGNRLEWDYLPLHLCSINIFIILSHALKPTKFKAEFLYAICLPGAAAALLFPGWPTLPFFNFLHIHSFTTHILLLMYPILLLAGGFKPDFRQLPKCLMLLITISPVLYVVNKRLDTNFWFLNHPGAGNPLALFEGWLGNPGYIAGFFVLLAIVWTILYLPAAIKNKSRQKEG